MFCLHNPKQKGFTIWKRRHVVDTSLTLLAKVGMETSFRVYKYFNWAVYRRKLAFASFAQKIHHFAQFPKLIKEMPLFWNSIFSKSSFNVKLNL